MDQVTMTILMLVVCFGLMYFLTIRPQKKKEEELKQMMETLEVGDSVLTTSGFYGVVVDKVDETTIIVEFGNEQTLPYSNGEISNPGNGKSERIII